MTSGFPRLFADKALDTLVAVGPAGQILYRHRGAETIFGYPAEEAAGKLLVELTVPAGRLAEEERFLREALQSRRGVHESLSRKKAGPFIYVTLTLPLAAWERTAV
jgi:PAS domain S-box-containing protein